MKKAIIIYTYTPHCIAILNVSDVTKMDIHILLVEDDEHICSIAKTFLENAGFTVDAFDDGLKAGKCFITISTSLLLDL